MSRPRAGLLVTADGAVFRGVSVGVEGVAVGEVVFNTSMTGYQEIVTDPSYAGQVVVMTAPHIGNYGVSRADDQSDRVQAKGLIVRELSRRTSSWRADGGLADYLRANRLVALSEVDTRRLTRHVRDHGAMPAAMGAGASASELLQRAQSAESMGGRDLATGVSTRESYRVESTAPRVAKVAAYDFGIKRDILAQMASRGLEITVVPAATPADEVLAMQPDGVFLSNGPGDPEPLTGPANAVAELLGKVPVFGICLGHQILGRALGASTFKLPFGHHGGNHPVRRLSDGRVEITSQNHGFAVDLWSLSGGDPAGQAARQIPVGAIATSFGDVVATHQNLNDGTLEGLRCMDVPAFSVQYHPEAAPGPRDSQGLFDLFIDMMEAEGA